MNDIKFPQYRKYQNGKSYFKINSFSEFEELKMLPGKHFEQHDFLAKILPDRNFIMDMLTDYQAFWVKIEEEEYLNVKSKIIK